MELQDFFHEHPKAALGFSGGVDSSYLLWAARQCGADVRPYYIKTAFQPEFEFEDAKRLCREIGAELTVLELDALSDPAVAANPADRCYHCKRNLFARSPRGRWPTATRSCSTDERLGRRGRSARHARAAGAFGALTAA